jgi:hypothetical protein
MLRLLLLVLILANGLYFAWTQGLLRAYDFAPAQQSEPQRMAQQVKPEALRVLTPAEYKGLEDQAKAAQTPTECLVAGPFSEAQAQALGRALEDKLPNGMWKMEPADISARWIIYMGKYTEAASLAKKRGELAAMNIKADDVTAPGLAMGLSLGAFDSQAAADNALAQFTKRGIRTAKVVQERAQGTGAELKFPAVTAALKQKIEEIRPQLAGQPLRSCAASTQ